MFVLLSTETKRRKAWIATFAGRRSALCQTALDRDLKQKSLNKVEKECVNFVEEVLLCERNFRFWIFCLLLEHHYVNSSSLMHDVFAALGCLELWVKPFIFSPFQICFKSMDVFRD